MLWARAICAWMASCTCCFPVPSTPVFWGAVELCFFDGREGTRELSPRLSVACSGSLRPSGMTSVVNSMCARRNGVKSPFRMALVRCALEKGCRRLTVPNTTAPAGITWRSNAYTGSRTLAWTGAPARFGARLVRSKRSGTPAGTTKGISCCWLASSDCGAAERMEKCAKPRTSIAALTRMDVGRRRTVLRVRPWLGLRRPTSAVVRNGEGCGRNRNTKSSRSPATASWPVMRFDDAAGKRVAIAANCAAHPTMLPACTLRFSADYVGALKAEVTKETGAATIFMQGSAGDQAANAGDKDYQAFGQALAREAVKLAQSLSPQEVAHPSLDCREERLRFSARTDFANPMVKAAYQKAFFPELVPNYIDEYVDGIRPRLTVALLNGEIALVGVSGEFFSNHAIRLKQRARVKQLFFFGYANGYHQYFPTIEAVAEGGYGADNAVSPAAVGAGEVVMDTALIRVYQMMGRIKN